jgi:predicted phage terminase large subunit-like protein
MFSLGLKRTPQPSPSSQAANALAKGLGVRRARSGPGADLSLTDFCVRTSFGAWRSAPHLALLAKELENLEAAIRAGRGYNVAVSMPVRHGKSELGAINFPAWFLCRNPDLRVILGTYGAELAYTHSRHARDLVEQHGPELYDVTVDPRSGAVSQWEIAGARGGLLAAGVGGPLTGHGGNLGIIDDPYKNRPEAESAARREHVVEWYQSSFATRLEPGAGQLVLMARWHVDDLIAWLASGEAGEWKIIELAALIETEEDRKRDPLKRGMGEALWPARWSRERLAQRKKNVGSYNWDSLFQQRPRKSEGTIFKREHFRVFHDRGTYYELETDAGPKRMPKDKCTRFQTVDVAASTKTSADYFVCSTWARTPDNDLLLLHVLRVRVEGPDQEPLLRTSYHTWKPAFQGIEKTAYQLTLVQACKRTGLPVRPVEADKDKLSRALPLAARYEVHAVFHPTEADWLEEWEQELIDFPNGKHDDQVDTGGYAAVALVKRIGGKPKVFVAGVNVGRRRDEDEEDEE